MESTPATTNRERRKRTRIRLRPNLTLAAQEGGNQVFYTLKDPISLHYFRLDQRQRFIVDLMDGARTLEEICHAYEEHFRPDRLSLEELEAFAAQLLASGLAQSESPGAGAAVFARSEDERRRRLRARLLNFLYIKLPLFDPDRFLDGLLFRTRFLVSLGFLLTGLAVMAAALGAVALHGDELLARLTSWRDLLSLETLFYAWLALGLVKILHELGHGLCCKAFGGEVHEMGILLLFFAPALYCDTSDSWAFPQRWQRVAVDAAGIFVELLIASLAAFVWCLSDSASSLHHFALVVLLFCSVHTVVLNANPLMRFDGYFVLSDWLGIPNLAEEASALLRSQLLSWLGIEGAEEQSGSRLRQKLLLGYALASQAYRWAILGGSLYLLHAALETYKLGSIAVLLALAVVGTLVGNVVYRVVRAVRLRGRLPDAYPARLGALIALGIVAGVVVCVLPLPQKVRGTALIQVDPDQCQEAVVPEPGGFLREIAVCDGQHVKADDTLTVLANPELEMKIRVNEAAQTSRLEQESALLAQLTDAGAAGDAVVESLQQNRLALRALEQELALLREQRERLTLRAPRDGVVLGLRPVEDKGKWLDRGTRVCRIGNDRALRAVFLIETPDRDLVRPGSPASVRIHGGGVQRWPGVITEVSLAEAKSIPPQLSSRAGGEVPTQQDPLSRNERPFQQHYLGTVRFQAGDGTSHPGVLGRVQVEAGSQTLLWEFRHYLSRTFRVGI